MPQFLLRSAALIAGACLMAVGGCASTQPSRFYLLTALPRLEATPQATPGARGPAIGVGPIVLPRYLDRPQIVTQASNYEVSVAEFERWAEPLEVNFTRVFAENMASSIPTDRLAMYPWPRSIPIDYQVTLEVVDFLGRLGGESTLTARWTLFRGEGQEVLARRKSVFSAPVGGGRYESLVAAMSQTLVDLSREIAAAIKTREPAATTR
jgi:uncharacterized protein